MKAILGQITKLRRSARGRGGRNGGFRFEVSFKPVCVMPERTKAPEWLTDQVLRVSRCVADPREIGSVGDSIVLTPQESEKYLHPLRVRPAIACGAVPEALELELQWWKDKKPPEFTVCAGGHRRTGKFRARPGRSFVASVATDKFFGQAPSLPVDFEIRFDKLKAGCAVLPVDSCCHRRLQTPDGERHLLRSRWYEVEVWGERAGGGISALRELGRGTDHFRADETLIGGVFDYSGHVDRVCLGWADRLGDVAMTSATGRREGSSGRLCLEGVLDKDRDIRTTVAYTVFDALPLVLIERDVLLHRPAKKEDKKDTDHARERIDDVQRLSLGFRAAFRAEPGAPASRIVSVDTDRLAAVRLTQTHDWLANGWRPADGWVLVEHWQRAECMLYVFDGAAAPELHASLGERVMSLEPSWLPHPVLPETGAGFALGLAAGETCGAAVAGAWVACRRAVGDGVACALAGRFREPIAEPSATFTVGSASASATMERLMLPGLGSVYVASVSIPKARMRDPFTATAGGVPARSES